MSTPNDRLNKLLGPFQPAAGDVAVWLPIRLLEEMSERVDRVRAEYQGKLQSQADAHKKALDSMIIECNRLRTELERVQK